MKRPHISLITVVYNDVKNIEKTILSVLNQNYKDFEYIIVDGNSTDGTKKLIQDHIQKIDVYVSENDLGVYDAMNKGIKLAKGKALLFLNSGDYFVGQVLSKKIQAPCFIQVKYYNHNNNLSDIKIRSYKRALPYNHQGIVFENKELFYDLNLTICSDYQFYLDHGYKNELKFINTSGYIYFDNEGLNQKSFIRREIELISIIFNNFGFIYSIIPSIKATIKISLKIILKIVKR